MLLLVFSQDKCHGRLKGRIAVARPSRTSSINHNNCLLVWIEPPLLHRPLPLIHSCTQQILSKHSIPVGMDTKSLEELAIKVTKAQPRKASDRFLREVEESYRASVKDHERSMLVEERDKLLDEVNERMNEFMAKKERQQLLDEIADKRKNAARTRAVLVAWSSSRPRHNHMPRWW